MMLPVTATTSVSLESLEPSRSERGHPVEEGMMPIWILIITSIAVTGDHTVHPKETASSTAVMADTVDLLTCIGDPRDDVVLLVGDAGDESAGQGGGNNEDLDCLYHRHTGRHKHTPTHGQTDRQTHTKGYTVSEIEWRNKMMLLEQMLTEQMLTDTRDGRTDTPLSRILPS